MNDLMDPRVAQVYEVLAEETALGTQTNLRIAAKIVELLDKQAERLEGQGA